MADRSSLLDLRLLELDPIEVGLIEFGGEISRRVSATELVPSSLAMAWPTPTERL